MTGVRSRYGLLGLGLMTGGTLFALAAWLILGYIPLVSLGVSSVILGAVSLAMGRSLHRISPDASLLLLEAGLENIGELIEEIGLRATAMYLPTSLTHGRSRALIPLHRNPERLLLQPRMEQRLIVRFGPGPEDYGLLVATLGSSALRTMEVAQGESLGDLEAILSRLLIGTLDLVAAVRVSRNGDGILVEVARPALLPNTHPAHAILGSPIASIAAAVSAEFLSRPVSVISESTKARWHTFELEVHPEVPS